MYVPPSGNISSDRQLRPTLDLSAKLRRDAGGELHFVCLQRGDAGGRFRHEAKPDRIEVGGLATRVAIAARRRDIGRVVVEPIKDEMAVLDPFAERKRTGADDVDSARGLILL